MQSLKFDTISLIFDPAVSHTFFKVSGAKKYRPKTKNLIFGGNANDLECLYVHHRFSRPRKWYRRKNEIKILYNIYLVRENDGEHNISTLNRLLYLQNQISGFRPISYCCRKLKIGVAGAAAWSNIDEIVWNFKLCIFSPNLKLKSFSQLVLKI